jgi:low temperature requirement protein LtrA
MTAPSIQDTPKQEYQVTPLELFFDLVFVFGVSQLSHHLLSQLSWRGAAETLVMLLTIFVVWFSTSWSATMIPVDEPRMRRMMLTVMLLGLFMNASVTRAFTTSAWAFILPFLLIQLGRAIWMIVNSTDAVFRDHYFRMLLWLIAATPLWIVGAAVAPEARLLWWVLAAGLDTIGRWLAHPIPGRRLQSENVPFDADHMLERCRLFLLIALGETVFTTGTAIAEATTTLMTLITGTFALVGTVALWALSFGWSNRLILQHLEETSDPIRTSRYAVNVLMVVVAGLIAIAVANEMVIVHPQEHVSLALSLLLGGGPILFLAAQGWYLWRILNIRSQLHLISGVAMLLVCLATLALPAYAALILVGASLTTLAILDQKMPNKRQSIKGV